MDREAPALGARAALSLIAAGVLVTVGVALAVLAVRSVSQTDTTEIAREMPGSGAAPHARVGAGDGDVAPAFEIRGYAGSSPVRLDAFRGHPIVLNFWASWCPPCRAEAAILNAAYLTYRSKGVVFIGIDMPNDTWRDSGAFLSRHRLSYPVGRDERGTVADAYRVTSLPTTYLISADGRIHGPAMTGGFIDAAGAHELAHAIEQLF